MILVEIVVYLLAEETDVDLYYFARLNDSKPDFQLPATYLSNPLCGTYFDGHTWRVFTYLGSLIGFKYIFQTEHRHKIT